MSYQDDLDWLARNITDQKIIGWFSRVGNVVSQTLSAGGCGSHKGLFTATEVMARRAELQNKPSFADHPDAKCLVQMSWGGWFKNKSDVTLERIGEKATLESCGKFEFIRTGEVLGDWRDTLEKRPDMHKNHEKMDTSAERVQKPAESMYVEHESPVDMAMSIIGADSLEPEFKPVSVSNETVQLEQPIVVVGTGAGSEPDANTSAILISDTLARLTFWPDHFSADELAELHQLCDAELTKRDAAVCGGQKCLDAHWFERGELPPVGALCEVMHCESWVVCDVIAHFQQKSAMVAAYTVGDSVKQLDSCIAEHFRPIRTERDLAVDEMKRHCPYHGSWETTYKLFAEALYDAGYRAGGAA